MNQMKPMASVPKTQTPSSEEEKKTTPQSNSILAAFQKEFATSVTDIFVNSLGESVQFKEISVDDQKTLSKTVIENESRRDIVYDTQCALINRLALKEGFDVYKLTEFDRIRILAEIYQNNYFGTTVSYKCPECGCENQYTLDFSKIIGKFDAFDLKDVVYRVEDSKHVFSFTLNFPGVGNVSAFYRQYMKKYRNVTSKEREVLDSLGNVDYINLFIKRIQVVSKANQNDKLEADLTVMTYAEIENLLALLPQSIIFSDDKGVLKYITTEFIEKLNSVFQYEKCAQCGAETKEGLGSLIDFF